jgi:hypothetical protein
VIILVPPIMRARAEHVSRDSIRDFSFKIRALGGANAPYRPAAFRTTRPTAPAPIVRPAVGVNLAGSTQGVYPGSSGGSERSAIRRRQVFSVLAIAVVVTGMLAISGTPGGWLLFGVSVGLLGAYVGLIAWFRPASRARIPMDRLAQVRYLPPAPRQAPAPEYIYRRSS